MRRKSGLCSWGLHHDPKGLDKLVGVNKFQLLCVDIWLNIGDQHKSSKDLGFFVSRSRIIDVIKIDSSSLVWKMMQFWWLFNSIFIIPGMLQHTV